MGVTIYDVAKKAHVGIGTVSRVINNSPHISPRTKEKVLKVIRELKYQPSVMARGLALKKTNIIACIVPIFTGYFYFEVLNGIQQALSTFGYDLILYSVDKAAKKEEVLKRTIRERKVDGVLLISLPISDKLASKFIESKLPIVLVDNYHEALDSITIENKQGAFIATEHLIKLGHRCIGMINGNLGSLPALDRFEGYRAALVDHNITCNEKFIVNSNSSVDPEINQNDGFNKKAGYRGMNQLLQNQNGRPTAIFVSSDIQAVGVIRAIQEHKLTIPKDIAIVGFDDIEMSAYLGLTTMKQPMFEMGTIAVNRLIEKIQHPEITNGAFKQLLHPKLIVRETCGMNQKIMQN